MASVASQTLTLESLAKVHYTVRGIFILTLMVSLLSVYFTLMQQRELNLSDPDAIRIWLWDGQEHSRTDREGRQVILRQSSLTSNIVLQLPFELLSIAIALFLIGLALYLGLVFAANVRVSTGSGGNRFSIIAFVVITAFTLSVFGQALGQKDREIEKCRRLQAGRAKAVSGAAGSGNVDRDGVNDLHMANGCEHSNEREASSTEKALEEGRLQEKTGSRGNT